MSAAGVKRCFVAVPIDPAVRADLVEAAAAFRPLAGLRLTAAEHLHLTVKFLGNVEDDRLEDVIAALRLATEGAGRFALNVEGLIVLPDSRRPRVLAAELDRPPGLLMLVEAMEDAMEAAGFPREGRVYRPHITLGRFRKPPRGALPTVDLVPTGFVANRIELMQSVLRPEGPQYNVMATLTFGD